jgi:hypothetical protein
MFQPYDAECGFDHLLAQAVQYIPVYVSQAYHTSYEGRTTMTSSCEKRDSATVILISAWPRT